MVRKIIIMGVIILILLGVYLLLNKYKEEIEMNDNTMMVNINGQDFTVELEENAATKELLKRLENGEVIIETEDYGNFEKVGSLGFNLPRSDKRITTEPGDIVLYEGNKISLFYNSNTWEYTKIGHIQNIGQDELINVLGKENVTIKLHI